MNFRKISITKIVLLLTLAYVNFNNFNVNFNFNRLEISLTLRTRRPQGAIPLVSLVGGKLSLKFGELGQQSFLFRNVHIGE